MSTIVSEVTASVKLETSVLTNPSVVAVPKMKVDLGTRRPDGHRTHSNSALPQRPLPSARHGGELVAVVRHPQMAGPLPISLAGRIHRPLEC